MTGKGFPIFKYQHGVELHRAGLPFQRTRYKISPIIIAKALEIWQGVLL
jgi:hypothetical protein